MSDIQPTGQGLAQAASKENNIIVEIIYLLFSGLSLIGQIFTVITYRSIRNKSNKFYSYIAWHSILGIPWAAASFFAAYYGAMGESLSCNITAFIESTSYTAYLIWSSVIAWAIFSSLKSSKRLKGLRLDSVVFTTLISLFLNLTAFLMDGYGPFYGNGITYCWYKERFSTPIIVGYYIPLGFTFFFNLICYVWSIKIARSSASEETVKSFRSLLVFPLIQIFCNCGWLLLRLERWVDSFLGPRHFKTGFQVLHVILARSQGFLEGLAYIFNPSVKREVQKAWCKKRNKQSLLYQPNVFDETNIESEISSRNERSKKMHQTLMMGGEPEHLSF